MLFQLVVICSAHPGRTDSNGGHKDRDGNYHYHHGYPEHLHTHGECPYDFDDKTGLSSGSSSGSSSSAKISGNDNSTEKNSKPNKINNIFLKILFFISPLIIYIPLSYFVLINLGNMWKYRNDYGYTDDEINFLMEEKRMFFSGMTSNQCLGMMRQIRKIWYFSAATTAITLHFSSTVGNVFYIIFDICLAVFVLGSFLNLLAIATAPKRSRLLFPELFRPAVYIQLCSFLYSTSVSALFLIMVKNFNW